MADAAPAPDKSRSLHNFSLPPRLSWGAQRLLRCSKANPATSEAPIPTPAAVDGNIQYHRRPRPYDGSFSSCRSRRDPTDAERNRKSPDDPLNSSPAAFGVEDDRIEVMREKLMIDLQTEVDKIKNAILAEGGDGESDPRLPPPPPWNLRTRRAACQEPNVNGAGDEPRPMLMLSPPPVKLPTENSAGEREKFSVSLSRQEIEDDFMELIRRRPARKPKKRPKYVQKQLDTLFPGLWLSEITADMYKVDENPEPVQQPEQ